MHVVQTKKVFDDDQSGSGLYIQINGNWYKLVQFGKNINDPYLSLSVPSRLIIMFWAEGFVAGWAFYQLCAWVLLLDDLHHQSHRVVYVQAHSGRFAGLISQSWRDAAPPSSSFFPSLLFFVQLLCEFACIGYPYRCRALLAIFVGSFGLQTFQSRVVATVLSNHWWLHDGVVLSANKQ